MIKFERTFLLHLFDYDKDRGQLIWKNPPKFQPQLVGKVAGTVQHHGHTSYNFVKINIF